MPSAPPPVASSSVPTTAPKRSSVQKNAPNRPAAGEAADRLIHTRIEEARRSLWWGELIRHCLKLFLGIVVSIGVWILVDHWVLSRPSLAGLNSWARVIALASLVGGAVAYAWRFIFPLIGKSISPEYAARSLEKNYPSLRQSLTSYITLKETSGQAGLQGRVVQSIGASTAGYLKQHDELPAEATGNMKLWVAAAVALASLVFYAAASPKNSLQSVQRLITPTASIAPVTGVSIKEVTPGDAEAIAGRSVLVTAEIRGLKSDEIAVCEIWYATGATQTTMRRDESLGAFSFVADIKLEHSASGDLPYSIKAGDATSPTYQFQVKDVPVVALESVNYSPPAYTGTAPFTRTSGAISAVEGTRITLNATTNRPIARAAIEFNPKPVGDTIRPTDGALEMSVGDDGRSLSVEFPLQIDQRRSASVRRDSYRIRVWDEAGANNPDPIIYPIDIIADLPPEVAIMLPTRVPKDVPIGTQQIIEVHASDADFGLSEIQLQITSGIRNIGEPVLWQDSDGERGNQVAEYRFRPNELGLSVGDVVRVIAIAIDNKSSELNDKVQGNQSKTDPIELRIVASDQMPPEEDAAGEGLSQPDDKPASDPKSSEESSSEENSSEGSGDGEQQQGGGGSEGDQGNSQAGESGQQGSGGGEGDQSEKNEGENQGEGGQSGSEGQKEGESQGNQSKSGNQGQGESETSENETGVGEAGQSDPMQGQSGEGQTGEADPGQGEQSEQQNGSQEGAGQNSQQNQSGQNDSGQGESQQGESQQSEAPGETDSSGESGDQSAPKHDGEAFERIQDYLNQKQQQQGQSGQQEGQKGEQPESGEPSQGESANQDSPGDLSAGNKSSQSNESESSKGDPSGNQASDSQQSEGQQGTPTDSPEITNESSGESEPSQIEDANDSNNQGSGEKNDGDAASSEQQSGEPQSSEKQSEEQSDTSEQGSEQGSESASKQSDQGTSNQADSGQAGSDQAEAEPTEGQPGSESESGGSDQTGSPTDDDSSTRSRSPNPSSQGRPGSGDGSGEGLEAESLKSPAQNNAANEDYARKATDMVLDYLDQTRDAPDQELLDRLNWTQQDLKQFQDRWKDIGNLDAAKNNNEPAANRATEEALRSLGLRPPSTGKNRSVREQSDSLKGIRDSGTRRRPPAALRDAFDAFRRQMGSGK